MGRRHAVRPGQSGASGVTDRGRDGLHRVPPLRPPGGLRNDLVVSEAGASTVTSFRLGDSGLDTLTASLPVGFGAACWVAVSPNGRFAYTGNSSGSISGFAIGTDGTLSPLGTTPTPSPRDLDFSRNGRFLYAVSPTGRATGYRVGSDGSLEQVTSIPAAPGITGAAAG